MSDLFISRELAEKDLLAAAAYLSERIRSSDGHAAAMNAVLPLYLSRGEVDLAAELANSVADPYSRDKLLTLVAEKCAEVDDVEYALQLADAVEDHGLQSQAYERIALVRAGKSDTAAASDIAETMAHPDFIYAGVAANQAERGDDASARASVEAIDFATARVSAAQHIASTFIAETRPDDAAAWLERGAESALDIEHDEEKIRALCDIGTLYIEARRNDKAIETFDTARGLAEQLDNSLRDFFLGNCAIGFLGAGSHELAEQTLDLITDKTQMASALVGFARDSWQKGEKDEALDTLEEAYAILRSQHERETRDSKSRNRLLNVIAVQFAGFGKTERAVELAHENPEAAEETDALSQVAQVLTLQNEDTLARQTINEIAEDADRMIALIGLADATLRRGQADTSNALLVEAHTLAESIPQLASRSYALNQLAVRFAEQGNAEKAGEICLENLEIISEVRDQSSQAGMLADLSIVAGRTGIDLGEAGQRVLLGILGSQ